MMKATMTKRLAGLLAAAMMFASLCGCAPAGPADAAPAASQSVPADSPAVGSAAPEAADPSGTPSAAGNTARDRFERAREQAGSGSPSDAQTEKPETGQTGTAYDVEYESLNRF